MNKRILHVINSMSMGGAETLVANSLAPGGLAEHADNWLVYFKGSSHLTSLIDDKVEQICLDYKGGKDLFRMLRNLKKIIIEKKIDIIHSHLTPADIYANLVRPFGVKQVHTIHTTYSMDTETRPALLFLEKKLYFSNKKTAVICLSDYTKKDFLETVPYKGKTFVLNNFVADRFFSDQSKKFDANCAKLKLVAAGSLKPIKNFEFLLAVFEYLVEEEIYLDIYGAGNPDDYNKLINEKKLKIRMMGPRPDMSVILPGYDLFIMPSKFEGYPLSMFEAAAAGLPVLLSDIPPLKMIMNHNAGYFDLSDPGALAETLRCILKGKTPINDLAEKGRQHAINKVKRSNYINKLLDIYNQL